MIPAHLAQATGATIYVPDYRLAPEHPSPAGLDDVLAVVGWTVAPTRPVSGLAGDSAGDGLPGALWEGE